MRIYFAETCLWQNGPPVTRCGVGACIKAGIIESIPAFNLNNF